MKFTAPVLAVALCLAMTISAAQAEEAEQPETTDAAPAEAEDAKQTSSQDNSSNTTSERRDTEIFIPSEEISEDFAVPFPVDI